MENRITSKIKVISTIQTFFKALIFFKKNCSTDRIIMFMNKHSRAKAPNKVTPP